ncbi:MAG: dephospho-CoA kinase [Deltaproteobacteria bacterium]|nr:dephospho-CoA kinase [Deltaproteobacteria bacterium]
MPVVIGLTGVIGSGKSAVARMLAEMDAAVVDADRIGHSVYEPGEPAFDELKTAFGEGIVGSDGRIARAKLAALVFASAQALGRLNAIVHPRIRQRLAAEVAELRAAARVPAIVIEAAVLLEAGWQDLCDEVWLVTAPAASVRERLAAERRMTPAQVAKRLGAQLSEEERRRHADVVIENDGTLEQLRARLAEIWQQRVASASSR